MRTLKLSPVLASAAVVLTLAACSGSDSDSASTPPSDVAATDAPTDASDPAAETEDDSAGESGTESAADSTGGAVNLEKSRFDPVDLEVSVGDTVTFTNSDPFAHTVTSKDGEALEFDSGEFVDGETFEVTFDEAGSIAYFCQIHPTMRGTVTAS
ncbi:plastocyanin/azurin family copper-binding protein [Ilumatobacter sp.]|uniref:cupredoxin domain-containing protein n=1 Tax=Ilumatobacter sp. TaxID=1967498 RepID=UPI003C3B429B